MKSILRIIFLSIILAEIDGKSEESLLKNSDSFTNQTLNVENVVKSDNMSTDLATSDQHFSLSYAKEEDDSYGNNNYENNGKSYLKEVHYFHDKEVGYERKHDWDSDNDEEISSKKIKKDLYNKRNNGKNYGFEDMIEVKKWDDEEPTLYPNNFKDNYNHDNNNYYYGNFADNRDKIKFYSNTNIKNNNNNNNNQNYKSDDNKDNNNYSHRKYGTEERAQERTEERGRGYSGYYEDNQKWFTNMEDKAQSGSTENVVKDEDNYNSFNSPKFIVNFHNFKPWSKMMRSRRHDDNDDNPDKISDNVQDNYEIYSNTRSRNQESKGDDRFNYEPKLLTNFNIKIRNENKDNYNNNNENYNKNKITNERETRNKKINSKETVKKLKSRPKNLRYHYEKRVVPQIYANSVTKNDDGYGNSYGSDARDNGYSSPKNEENKKFIEMPYDMFNTGWSSVQKPRRQKTNGKVVPKVRQYRYGF